MNWFTETCEDVVCGGSLGMVKGIFGVSFFTPSEVDEIHNYKKLALSVMEKSPDIVTDSVICDAIRQGQQSGLDAFSKKASPEVVAAGAVAAADLVCNKAFKQRFADVLMGACLNLTGC